MPFGNKYAAINLFGVFFVKPGVTISPRLITHESIHTLQMRELLYIGFYIAYLLEWLYQFIKSGGNNHKAYLRISHEREAYANENNPDYLSTRKRFAQWRAPVTI